MKTLFIVMAALETATGLALIVSPSTLTWLLLGSSLDASPAIIIARLAGLALLSLGAVCWFAGLGRKSGMLAGPTAAMLIYNIGATALLAYARIGLGLSGLALWPALLVHSALAAGCIAGQWPRLVNPLFQDARPPT
jgi:hypothetical protein